MKDSLFEILLNLFEKTLAQLKENSENAQRVDLSDEKSLTQSAESPETAAATETPAPVQARLLQAEKATSIRVFNHDERLRLTKASYQFITRLRSWGIVSPEVLELIINRLMYSESRFVSLYETKWTIRNTLASNLSSEQLLFLDLILFQREDGMRLH